MTEHKKPKQTNLPLGKNGYPQTGIKEYGIQVRGGKAQTKGRMARGPMA